MNKQKLISLCHKVRKKTNLSFNSIMIYFFLESILKQLANSKYKENFVFKGGFLLSNVVGLRARSTTVDLDLLLNNISLTKSNVQKLLEEVLDNNSDGIIYEIKKVEKIKQEDQYGGFRISVLCKFDNIKQQVPLDIATGDIVTPSTVDFKYLSVFKKEEIPIKSYPIETIIAEKLQTIYSLGFLNSRSKDYYDLFILYKLKREEIDWKILEEACTRTFKNRSTKFDIKLIHELLQSLKKDSSFITRWKAYRKKNSYVGNITFNEVVDTAVLLLQEMSNIAEA